MNRDALTYLQVSRAASSDKQTLSWTMYVPLRKFPSSTKSLLKTKLVIFATTLRPISHAHRNFKLTDCRTLCRNTLEQAKCYKSGTGTHPRSRLLLGKHTRANVNYRHCFLFARLLKQRTKHHVQEGRPIAEFSLLATKERWSLMMTPRSSIGRKCLFESVLTNYIYGRWVGR